MTAPTFGNPNTNSAPQAPGGAPQAPQADQQSQEPQANQQQNPLAQGQNQNQASQGNQQAQGQASQGNQQAQGQAPQVQASTFTPVQAHGFSSEVPNVSKFIRLGDHIGKHVLIRINGFGTRTFNQAEGPKETVECDVVVFGADANGNMAEPEVFTDQGLSNGKIIAACRALSNQGNSVTAGVLSYGEGTGGNNKPIVLQSIDTSIESGQQMLNYLVQYGQYLGWIQQ